MRLHPRTLQRLPSVAACLSLASLLLSLCLPRCGQAQNSPQVRSLPVAERSLEFEIRPRPGFNFPSYQQGFLIERQIAATSGNNILLRNVSSGESLELSHHIAGSDKTVLTATAIGSAGILSAGYAVNGASAKYFLAISERDGGRLNLIETHGYLASALCEGTDGTIWTLGSRPHGTGKESFSALRQYNTDGKLLSGAIPTKNEDKEFLLASLDPRQIHLACVQQNVFVYDDVSRHLYRYDTRSAKTTVWTVQPPTAMSEPQMTGFAISSDGKIFVSLKQGENRRRSLRGLFQLVGGQGNQATLQPVTGTVDASSTPGQFWLLLGAEGKQLVYVARPFAGHTETLNWITPK